MTDYEKRILAFALLVVCGLWPALVCPLPATAQKQKPQVLSNAIVRYPVASDISQPLRDLPVESATAVAAASSIRLIHPPLRPKLSASSRAPLQSAPASAGATPRFAAPLTSASIGLGVQGVGNTSSNNCPSVAGTTVAPPDTNLAVGDTQVVQWVNLCYAVFDKATGALLAGPLAGNHFWSGFNNACAFFNDGDIIIQWDKANHRWVASQNVFQLSGYLTCIAVSKTADATGSYNRYAFRQPGLPDYPKWGLTPNVYYQTQNDFGNGGSAFVGVNVCAYDGVALRSGSSRVKQICIVDNSNGTLFDDSMLPADNDFAPPAGAPNPPEVLVGSIDNFFPGGSQVYEYIFTVNFKKGTATLKGANGSMPITVPAYELGCGGGACVPQPSPGSEVLDTLGDRLMYRLAHFDNGTKQYWLVGHSVNDSSGAVGTRWYQFTAPEGSQSLSLAQSGQTPADGEYRWMGSVAMDKTGNIAIGYSRSSANAGDFPSIYVADSTGSEAVIHQGAGSQFSTGDRWGDYSSMALDGDGCTLWYTNEFYEFDGSFAWATWLAPIKFGGCN